MTQQLRDDHRYCATCGASFAATAVQCPECGARWQAPRLGEDIPSLTTLLSTIQLWYRDGLIDRATFGVLRGRYQARLDRVRPPRSASPAPTTAAAPATAPPAPPAPRFELREWAVERQADILLYLGAFLLVIAALIFVSSRGATFGGAARVTLLAVYTAGFIVAGLLVKRWERVREAGRVFLALGALLTPLNFLLIHVELLDQRGVAPAAVWLAASVYSTAFYGALATGGYGRLYALPATVALFSAWAALFAVVDLPDHWLGAWWMAAATAITAAAALLRRLGAGLLVGAAALAVLSLLGAHILATFEDHHAQLPVTYALLSAGVVIGGWRWRQPAALLVATTTVIGAAVATLWAAGAGREWYAYPVLVAGALIVGARPLWSHWSRDVTRTGWAYAGGCAAIPLLFTESFAGGASAALSWHGAVTHLAGAGLLAVVAWRNRTDGLTSEAAGQATNIAERVLFGWAAFAMLLVAVGYTHDALSVTRPDSGWAFAAIGVATAAALAATARRRERAVWALLPPLLATTAVSLQSWERFPGHDAILLWLPAAELAAAFAWTRRWTLAAVALALAGAAMAATWLAVDWPLWTLGAAYGVAAVALFVVLDPQRRARPAWPQSIDDAWVLAMSWAMAIAAPATAVIALDRRVEAGAAVAAETVDYRALVVLVLVVAGLIAVEGWRLRLWSIEVGAVALAGAAVAMAWPVFGWPAWTLAVAYATVGVALFATLKRWRRYGPGGEQAAVVALSWGGVAAGLVTAAIALAERVDEGHVAAATAEYRTLALLVLLLAPMVAFEAQRLRLWSAAVVAVIAAGAAVAMAWPVFDWSAWTLALAYAAGGGAIFLAVTPWRRYGSKLEPASTVVLSWGGVAAGLLVARLALIERVDVDGATAVATVEHRTLTLLVLLLAPMIAFDARRLRRRWAYIPASSAAMVALMMAIAITEPTNVQAYTVPVSIYLGAVGLAVRRSEPVVPKHLMLHEAVLLAGAAMLVLPQAQQGFAPGGWVWALVLLVEGGAFVAIAFLLAARWLAVSGVVTVSGVAIRMLLESSDVIPYWLTLSVAGFLLMGVGVLLLLERERWERVRSRTGQWWERASLGACEGAATIPSAALLVAAAPAVAAGIAAA